jgi:hypothetical protein
VTISEVEGTHIVRFKETVDGHIVGRVEGDSAPVYVHKDSLPAKAGEVWECRLEENQGPNGRNYFATLLEKVEEAVAEVEGAFEKPEVSENPADDEEGFVIDNGSKPIVEKELLDEDEYKIMDDQEGEDMRSLFAQVMRSGKVKTMVMGRSRDMRGVRGLSPSRVGWEGVVRYEGNNTLYSDMLEPGSYIVYASLKECKIQIIPNEDGDIGCVNGRLRIAGLDEMMGGMEGRVLPHKDEGGIITVFVNRVRNSGQRHSLLWPQQMV